MISQVVAFVAAIFVFFPTLVSLFHRWSEPVSYYDHAVLIPLVCIGMAWRARADSTTDLRPTKAWIGSLFLLFGALSLQTIAISQQITVLFGASLVLWIWASVLWFYGTEGFKRYQWPLLYSLLLIPVPTFFMAQLTFRLRELSTILAAFALKVLMAIAGLPFSQVGNRLNFSHYHVTIVDACSGLNTLITVISIGFILVYLETSRAKAWVVTALLIPTAILANLIRILVLCAFVALGMGDFAFGAGHSGIGVATVGLALVFLALGVRVPMNWETSANTNSQTVPLTNSDSADSEPQNPGRILAKNLVFSGVLILFALLAARIQFRSTTALVAKASDNTQIQFNIPGWKSTETAVDQTTFDVVGTQDARMFKFERESDDKLPVFFYRIHSQDSRKIGHPPELCYLSERYQIRSKTREILKINDREIPYVRMIVQRGKYALLVYYWYRMGGTDTSSYLEHQVLWSLNQIKKLAWMDPATDGSMIRVSTEIRVAKDVNEAVQSAEKRLNDWVAAQDSIHRSSL